MSWEDELEKDVEEVAEKQGNKWDEGDSDKEGAHGSVLWTWEISCGMLTGYSVMVSEV